MHCPSLRIVTVNIYDVNVEVAWLQHTLQHTVSVRFLIVVTHPRPDSSSGNYAVQRLLESIRMTANDGGGAALRYVTLASPDVSPVILASYEKRRDLRGCRPRLSS